MRGFGFCPEGNEKAVKSIKLESNLISLVSPKAHSGYSAQSVMETEGKQLRGFCSNPDQNMLVVWAVVVMWHRSGGKEEGKSITRILVS